MTSYTIEVVGLGHSFGAGSKAAHAVDDVSFQVKKGEFFALLGPSGCGKTTTLRCIAGLERPTRGEIRLNGEVVVSGKRFVPTNMRDIGMVFQDYAVWPHMTVFRNVAFPLKFGGHRLSRREIQDRVESMLVLVGLEHLAGRKGTDLSGGQQQRVALARALVRKPAVLLLDEPLSNLDAGLRERLRGELREIQRQVGVTTILVTHDQVEALSMANRIALMKEGKIVQLGTPRELYNEPTTQFSAQFLGTGALYEGTVGAINGKTVIADTSLGRVEGVSYESHHVGDRVAVAVRSEDISVHAVPPKGADGISVFPGRVRNIYYLGGSVDVQIEAGGQLIRAKVPAAGFSLNAGDDVSIVVAVASCVIVGI